MKRKESKYAIECYSYCGPIFGNDDIHIGDNCYNHCYKENSHLIGNDGERGYECHPVYKKSLFVNTAGPDVRNYFTLLDYEVYAYE